MNSHKHARLTPKGRALLVSRVLDEGWTEPPPHDVRRDVPFTMERLL